MLDVTNIRAIVDTFYGEEETIGYIYDYADGVTVVSIVDAHDRVIDGDTFRHGVSKRAIIRRFFEDFDAPYIRIVKA